MAITAVGTITQSAPTTGQGTISVTTTTSGDLICLWTVIPSTTITVTAVSGGTANATGWAQVGTAIVDATGGDTLQMWWATVGTPGTANVNITYSASVGATGVQRSLQQFTAGLGAGTAWRVDTSNAQVNAASTVMTFPTLVPSGSGELYVGLGAPQAGTTNTPSAGYTYQTDAFADALLYNTSVGTSQSPTCGQTSGTSATKAAIFATNVQLSRTAADNAAATDTAARSAQSFTRTAGDGAAAADTATRTAAFTRTATDAAAAADSATRVTGGKSASDNAPASDTAARGAQAFSRAAADAAAAADAVTRLLPRTVSDLAGATDTATRSALTLSRAAGDVAAASDAASRAPLTLTRTAVDGAAAVDSVGPPVVVRATNASPNWPLMGFEVDFQTGPPNTPGVTRQSINAKYRRLFARRWDVARGRQYELNQVQAGTCSITLPDPNELLNPDNTGSPFNQSGNQVTPYRAVRIWGMWPNQPGSGNINIPAVDTGADPGFELTTGVGGWTSSNGTGLIRSTTVAFEGTHSLNVGQLIAGASGGATRGFTTAPGVTYTFSCYVYPTGGASVTAQVVDANGATTTSATATVQNAWTRLSLTWLTVDTLEQVTVFGTVSGSPSFYLDAVMVEFGSVLHAYTSSGPTLYPIFTGYVERYPTAYDMSGLRALRPLQAVDALAILSRTAINQSYDAEILADNPAMYYRMDNAVTPTGSAQLDTGATGAKLGPGMGPGAVPYFTISPSGSVNWGGDTQPDGTRAVAFTGQNSTNPPTLFSANSFTEMPVQGGAITLNPQNGFTWECWVKWVSGTVQVGTLEVLNPGAPYGLNYNVPLIGAGDFGANNLGFAYNPDGTSFSSVYRAGSAIYPDGRWHYLYMIVQGGSWQIGQDNSGLSGIVSKASVGPIAFNTFYTEASAQYSVAQAQSSTGRFAVYNTVLSTTRLAAHYQRGMGYSGEKSGARVTRLLGKYWTGATSVATGSALMAPDFTYSPVSSGATSQPRTVLDVCQEIQETERGLLYVSAAGTVVFQDRSSRYATQTASVVFGENPTNVVGTEWPYWDIKYDHDPTYTFSQANLSRPGNSGYPPQVNTGTQAKYGQRILSQTVQVAQDFDLSQAGIFYLRRYGTPTTRVSTLVLKPSANPALFPIAMGMEISQRITVTRRSAFTRSSDYYVENVAHAVDAAPGDWTTTLQLSPVFVPSAWVLGDATYGVVGSTTIPIY